MSRLPPEQFVQSHEKIRLPGISIKMLARFMVSETPATMFIIRCHSPQHAEEEGCRQATHAALHARRAKPRQPISSPTGAMISATQRCGFAADTARVRRRAPTGHKGRAKAKPSAGRVKPRRSSGRTAFQRSIAEALRPAPRLKDATG